MFQKVVLVLKSASSLFQGGCQAKLDGVVNGSGIIVPIKIVAVIKHGLQIRADYINAPLLKIRKQGGVAPLSAETGW